MSHAHIDPVTGSPRSTIPLRSMTLWDRTAIVLLGAAGFAFSYDALRQIAIAIHARETLSYLFPLFIDGFIAYGVRAIVLLRHQPFLSRLYTWFLFLAATAASLGANALHAITLNRGPQSAQSALHLADSVVGVLSMLAPLALAGSVHLYILMARTAELSVRDGVDAGPGPVRQGGQDFASDAQATGPGPLGTGADSGTAPAAPAPSGTVHTPVDLRKPAHHRPEEPPAAGPGAIPSAAADQADDRRGPADGQPSGRRDQEVPAPSPAAAEASVLEPVRSRADGDEPSVPDDAELPQDREAPQSPAAAEASVLEPVRSRADGDEPSVPDDAELPQDREAPQSPTAAEAPVPEPVRSRADGDEPSVPDDAELPQDREADDDWLEDLLPVARAAYQESGRISRDAIKEAVRARQPISNDRLGILLARLKDEMDQRAGAPAAASSALW